MAIIIPLKSVFDDKGLKDGKSALGSFAKFAAGALSVAAVGSFLGDSAKAASDDRKSQALLATQLKNTTGANKAQIAGVEDSISAMENLSSVADDKIRPAFAQLTRATGDVGKATDLTRLALDVSAGTGKDVGAVAVALGKAYQGNSGALQKLGINVKGMKDPLGSLKDQFDGAAKVAADQDPYTKMGLAMDNIKEAVGTMLLPVLDKLATWLQDVVPKVQDFFKQLKDPTTEVGGAWKTLTDILKTVFTFIKDNIAPIGAFVGVILAVKGAVELWTISQTILNAVMTANPIGLIVIAVAALVAGIVYLATQTTFFQDTWKAMSEFFTDSVKVLGDVWNGFIGFLTDAWGNITAAFTTVFDGIGTLFKGYVNMWIGIFESFINFFVNGINGTLQGLNIVLDGIKTATGGTINLRVAEMAKVSLPRLANGGIVPAQIGGQQVTVGEGGQAEAIIPLNRLSDMMTLPKKAPAQGSSVNVIINAGMGADGGSIARQLVTVLKKYERTNGAVWQSA
jgi:phage-related protein